MQIIKTIVDLRATINTWRTEGKHVAFVPTMGNLHAGHLKLVEEAKGAADKVVVSIFVNPTQFGEGEDFDDYPRTEDEDKQKLDDAGIDLLFLPSVLEMYGEDSKTIVSVKNLSTIYCGKSRPGHFDGVATVVCKLLNMVQPDLAFFGQKDFQQLTVIRSIVKDLNIPVEIRSVETVREDSGLAKSSRNGYLTQREFEELAPRLYQALCLAQDEIVLDKKPYETIEHEAMVFLQNAGFVVEYFNICRTVDLLSANKLDTDIVILAAAKLGRTRLIDNICFSVSTYSCL